MLALTTVISNKGVGQTMTTSTPPSGPSDELLAPGFLAGVEDRPIGQLRAMRDRAEAEEHRVSYARRLLQGRIDLLRAEVEARRDHGAAARAHRTLEELSGVLADRGPSQPVDPARVRPPQSVQPPDDVDDLLDQHEVDLDSLDDEGLAQLAERYADRERELSGVRRELFGVIDRLQDEIAARYRSGTASVGDLLADGG